MTSDKEAAESLPVLTAKQEAFVFGILAGKTASEAYRQAYDAENMSPNAIKVEASRLRASPNVALTLSHYRKHALQQGTVTLESHLAELASLRELAKEKGQVGAGVNAEVAIGKVTGLYADKLADAKGAADLVTALRKLDPELGHELAVRYGVAHLLEREKAQTQH